MSTLHIAMQLKAWTFPNRIDAYTNRPSLVHNISAPPDGHSTSVSAPGVLSVNARILPISGRSSAALSVPVRASYLSGTIELSDSFTTYAKGALGLNAKCRGP